MYSVVVVQEVLQSWSASWRWGAEWLVIESLQQSVESQHWSWSSSNYMRSCRRTQHWPFYSCSAFEENGEGEKAQYVGLGSWPQIKRIKKIIVWKCCFLFFCATLNHFSIRLWHVMKHGFYAKPVRTSSVDKVRRSPKALPKATLAPTKCHDHFWWSAAGLIR